MNLRSSTAPTRENVVISRETELLEAVRSLKQENMDLAEQIDDLHLKVRLLDLVGCISPFLKLFSAQLSRQFLSVPDNKIFEGRKIMLQ